MNSKEEILKSNGTFNKDSKSVIAEDFKSGIFFDPKDIVQVKYEMLRSVANNESSVSEASKKYGLSRQSYYVSKTSMEEGGIAGLLPRKTGPRNAYKLTDEGKQFIDSYTTSHPDAKTREINSVMLAETGISVHDRTVRRYLSKKSLSSR